LTAGGVATQQIGTASSAEFVLRKVQVRASPHAWGWTDNGWGRSGDPVQFASDREHTCDSKTRGRRHRRSDRLSPGDYSQSSEGRDRHTRSRTRPAHRNRHRRARRHSPATQSTTTSRERHSDSPTTSASLVHMVRDGRAPAWVSWSGIQRERDRAALSFQTRREHRRRPTFLGEIAIGDQTFQMLLRRPGHQPLRVSFTLRREREFLRGRRLPGRSTITASEPSMRWAATTAAGWLTVESGGRRLGYRKRFGVVNGPANPGAARSGGHRRRCSAFAVKTGCGSGAPPAPRLRPALGRWMQPRKRSVPRGELGHHSAPHRMRVHMEGPSRLIRSWS